MEKLKKKIKIFLLGLKVNKYLDKDLKLTIALYSIVTFLDKEAKDIEILDSDMLIEKFIRSKFKNNKDESMVKSLKTYCHHIYMEYLKKYKHDENYFELKKQEVLSTLKKQDKKSSIKKDLYQNVLLIIEADGVKTDEESDFIKQIKKVF